MSQTTIWDAALSYACGMDAAAAFAKTPLFSHIVSPVDADLQTVLSSVADMDDDTRTRLVHFTYALAAMLPNSDTVVFPHTDANSALKKLYPNRPALEPLLSVIDHLNALRESCDALPDGSFQLVKAEGDLLHFSRSGPTEILDAIFNRGPHLLLEEIDDKSTQVNPYGFTLTVREHGHNANHSYYDYR